MINDWHNFLQQQGATRNDAGEWSFGKSDQSSSKLAADNILCYLPYQSLLAVTGPDSVKFLQGQLTCDCREIQPDNTALGAHCTAKGRMVSSFRMGCLNSEHFLLRMHHSIVEKTRLSLGKYIVFSKAELYDYSEQWVVLGVAGEHSKAALNKLYPTLPDAKNRCIQGDDALVIQLDEVGKRFEIWCTTKQAPDIWQTLNGQLQAVDESIWKLIDIEQGLGAVELATAEEFIPQMLNLQIVGGISFKKGCYTGQEIVARMQYLGKLKRHMYRLSGESAELPLPGTTLFSVNNEQSVGNVVNAVMTAPNQFQLLAVITEKAVEENNLHLGSQSGPILQLLSLPYAINKESKNA